MHQKTSFNPPHKILNTQYSMSMSGYEKEGKKGYIYIYIIYYINIEFSLHVCGFDSTH